MDATSGDYEAPKDPGVQQTHYQTFSEKDFEGKYEFFLNNSLVSLRKYFVIRRWFS